MKEKSRKKGEKIHCFKEGLKLILSRDSQENKFLQTKNFVEFLKMALTVKPSELIRFNPRGSSKTF